MVTNLSDSPLTANELSVLNKGLTFVPNTNQVKFTEIGSDIKRFERRLQLHFQFTDP